MPAPGKNTLPYLANQVKGVKFTANGLQSRLSKQEFAAINKLHERGKFTAQFLLIKVVLKLEYVDIEDGEIFFIKIKAIYSNKNYFLLK